MKNTLAACVVLTALAASSAADPHDDLAFDVQENADYTRGQIVKKLMTFKLGAKCWDKVVDKQHFARRSVMAVASQIAGHAKDVTGDDWQGIESQSANSKERNRALVDGMIDAFKKRFHLTISVEGADCDASGNALWLKYLGQAGEALEKYPPKSGKAFITIHVVGNAKGAKTTVSKDGTKYTITAARDVEASGWPDNIDKPFKRVSTKN